MPDVYIVNPLSKEAEPEARKEPEAKKEDPDEARDMSLCCLTYFFCFIPIIAGSTG
jgi:hypothetical protein